MKLEKIIAQGRKFIGTSLLVGAFVNPFLINNVQAKNQEASRRLSVSADFVTQYETRLVDNVRNIPLEIRLVSGHPDDWRSINPIEDGTINLYNRISLGGKLGRRISFSDDIALVLGGGIDFTFNDQFWKGNGKRKDVKERDYYKKSIVEKSSCPIIESITASYYQIYPAFISDRNKVLRPSIYSEIEAQVADETSFALGCELFREKLMAEKGWDRSGKLEMDERYDLANLTAGKFYASLRVCGEPEENQYGSIDLGIISLLKKDIRGIGKQADIDFKDYGWFFGIRVGGRF